MVNTYLLLMASPDACLALNKLANLDEHSRHAAKAFNWNLDREFLQFLAAVRAASAAIWESWTQNRERHNSRRGLKRSLDDFLEIGHDSPSSFKVNEDERSLAPKFAYNVPTTIDQLSLSMDNLQPDNLTILEISQEI